MAGFSKLYCIGGLGGFEEFSGLNRIQIDPDHPKEAIESIRKYC